MTNVFRTLGSRAVKTTIYFTIKIPYILHEEEKKQEYPFSNYTKINITDEIVLLMRKSSILIVFQAVNVLILFVVIDSIYIFKQ